MNFDLRDIFRNRKIRKKYKISETQFAEIVDALTGDALEQLFENKVYELPEDLGLLKIDKSKKGKTFTKRLFLNQEVVYHRTKDKCMDVINYCPEENDRPLSIRHFLKHKLHQKDFAEFLRKITEKEI